MARPNKTGLDYFPFDVDFFEDEKIIAISGEFGIKGEITAIKLLCAIYRNGYFILWNDLLKYKLLKNLPGISPELIESIVHRLVLWEFFDKALFDSVKVLTSKGIQRRYFEAVKRRKIDGELPYLLINVCNNTFSNDINVDKNTTKEIKGKEKEIKEEYIPPTAPPCGDAAAAKSWRDDFEIYKSELKDAFDKIISEESFIEDRQKYHPNVDIRLSLQKAYEDYWSTEAGWKKKKASKTKEIDWKATFRKALDQPQNRVYKQNRISKPEPEQAMSELQEKFAKYLKEHAPMLLQMPLQPTDEEIKALKGAMRIEVLLDLIKKINNDKYLTTRKNSVFQTIMELKQKEYGTT